MDPYGFALENYDGFGAWRDQDNRVDVDASGEIDGKTFKTSVEFRAMLAGRRDDFRRGFIKKMMSYALGRGMRGFDRPALEAVGAQVQKDGDTVLSVVVNIARSYPFQHARGLKGEKPAPAADTSSALYHPVFVPPPVDPNAPVRGRGRGRGQGGRGQGPGRGVGPAAEIPQ
jgi:hypothetical protein